MGLLTSGVHDQSVALVLQTDELTHGGGNEQRTGNQVRLDVGDDLLGCLLIRVLLTGGDLTGLPMNGLVSYQEQNASPLEAFDAGVRVIRVGAFGGRLADWRVLAGEPDVARRGLARARVLDLEHLAQAVLRPDRVVVHGEIRRRERLDDNLYLIGRHVV